MKKKLIITCRINEYKSRDENPHVPFTPDEIAETAAECRQAGVYYSFPFSKFRRKPLSRFRSL